MKKKTLPKLKKHALELLIVLHVRSGKNGGRMPVKIESFISPDVQMSQIGRHHWSVSRLFELARELPVMNISLDHLNIYHKYEDITLRDMVMHMKAVNEANLDYPIILDEDGDMMDGRHRLMKALLTGAKTIKAVRFEKNPSPCKVDP